MSQGVPDRERFRAAVVPLLQEAGAGGRTVHVYGELVALLLAHGDVAATIAVEDHLEREWALAARGGPDSFALIADLDDFKSLNDTYGHAVGDTVLRQFGEALRLAARGTDVVARIGGDEFGILLVRCNERAVHAFAHRLDGSLAERLDQRFAPIGVSLGHASLRHSRSPATAMDRADLAMLALKRARRRRRGGHPRPA